MPVGPEPLSVAFGSAVRAARTRRGLSQEALARIAQVQRTYVVDLEGGRRNVTLRTVHRFASALGLSLSELMAAVDAELASP